MPSYSYTMQAYAHIHAHNTALTHTQVEFLLFEIDCDFGVTFPYRDLSDIHSGYISLALNVKTKVIVKEVCVDPTPSHATYLPNYAWP